MPGESGLVLSVKLAGEGSVLVDGLWVSAKGEVTCVINDETVVVELDTEALQAGKVRVVDGDGQGWEYDVKSGKWAREGENYPSIDVLVEKVPHTMSYMGKDVISQVEEGVYRIDNELTNIHEELRLVELNGQITLEGVTTGAHYYHVNAKNEWQRLDAFLWHGERTVPGQLLGTPVPAGIGAETVQKVAGEYRGYETVRIGDEQVILINLFVGYDTNGQERIMQVKAPPWYGEGNFAFSINNCVGGLID